MRLWRVSAHHEEVVHVKGSLGLSQVGDVHVSEGWVEVLDVDLAGLDGIL